MNAIDLLAALPILSLLILSLVLILLPDLILGKRIKVLSALPSLTAGLSCLFFGIFNSEKQHLTVFSGLVLLDGISSVFGFLICACAALSILISYNRIDLEGVKESADREMLISFATIGALVMVLANNLLLMFIGLELLSLSLYPLVASARDQRASTEAALKYFILGSFASAFLLFGLALIYGATGTLNISELSSKVLSAPPGLISIGFIFSLFGLCFKIGAAPFHYWLPDTYHGAPNSIAVYMSSVVKVAAFGVFFRFFGEAFINWRDYWVAGLWLISVLSMTIGNLLALKQTSFKRMLACSSIAHAGYLLIGIVAINSGGGGALAVYLSGYVIMSLLAFGVVVALGTSDNQYERDSLETFNDLGSRSPLLAFLLTIALFSLAGMPPFVGFIGKLSLIYAAVQGGFYGLAIIAVLNSAIALYYYLSVIKRMYFNKFESHFEIPHLGFSTNFALCFCALILVGFGIIPSPLIDTIRYLVER